MQQLALLVSVAFIYTVSLLLAGHTKDYYFVFNLCAIPIVVSGYFSKKFGTLLLTAFCCILGLTLIPGGAPVASVLGGIFLFLGCALIATIIDKSFFKLREHSQDGLKSSGEKFAASQLKAQEINNSKLRLENKTSEIIKLYHSAKKMGSCFAFADLLRTLRDAITESFKFKRCKLITLYELDGVIKIDKIHHIGAGKIEQAQGTGYEEGLLKVMLRKKQMLMINIGKEKPDVEEFIFPEKLTTFIAAPIIAGDRTNAILAVEDMDLQQHEKFAVVVNQFSMALERIRLYELVQELAITDGLTGVFVRRHLLERLNEELIRAEQFNARVSTLMIDVDDFKEYNDKYGHLKGDILLKKIASALKENIRDIDIIGRYGGEEFCIVLTDTDSEGAEFLGDRLRQSVEALKATISIGVSTYPENAKESSHLLEKADKMLYKAKGAGKNRVCVYEKK